MKDLVKKIEATMDAFKVNAEAQVVKGNKAAGARARKAALELKSYDGKKNSSVTGAITQVYIIIIAEPSGDVATPSRSMTFVS